MPGWKSAYEDFPDADPAFLAGGDRIADDKKDQGSPLQWIALVLNAIRLVFEILR